MSALVAHGWHREPLGWDHTNMKWYYPIWPELDDNLESPLDRSKIRLKLDWGDGGGHNSEASDTSVQEQLESVTSQVPGKDEQTTIG